MTDKNTPADELIETALRFKPSNMPVGDICDEEWLAIFHQRREAAKKLNLGNEHA